MDVGRINYFGWVFWVLLVSVVEVGCAKRMPVGVSPLASANFADSAVAELALAAERGDISKMDSMVRTGADINGEGVEGITPAWWAIYHGKLRSFSWLLDHGASPNPSVATLSIVDLAARMSDSCYLREAIKHGVDVNYIGGSSRSALNSAIGFDRMDNFKILLANGADVNQIEGGLPLAFAANLDAYKYVFLLLKAGADPAKTLDGRRSALALAIGSG